MRWILHGICYGLGHVASKLMFADGIWCRIFWQPYQKLMAWSLFLQGKKLGKWWLWGAPMYEIDDIENEEEK